MIKLLTHKSCRTVSGHVYHQLLWSYLDCYSQIAFVIALLVSINGILKNVRESKSVLLQISSVQLAHQLSVLASKLKCNFTWHVF